MDANDDGLISLEEYNKERFDFIHDPEISKLMTEEEIESVKTANEKDPRRFIDADLDRDGQLNATEFAAFLHPHTQPHMHEVVVKETLEDMDQNNDGLIDEDEYIIFEKGDVKVSLFYD